jgi:phosphohistidine phosphatase
MRTLIVMRHSKAERGEGKADYDRALEQRGWADGDRVGAALAAGKLVPDAVLCSAARRTRETFAAVLPHIPGDCRVEFRRALYEAEASDLAEAIRGFAGEVVLLIGHNPAIQGFAASLAGTDAVKAGLKGSFPTSQAAVFFVGSGLDAARLEKVVTP